LVSLGRPGAVKAIQDKIPDYHIQGTHSEISSIGRSKFWLGRFDWHELHTCGFQQRTMQTREPLEIFHNGLREVTEADIASMHLKESCTPGTTIVERARHFYSNKVENKKKKTRLT